jgi:putative endonuclease
MNKQPLSRKQLGTIGEGFAYEYLQQMEYQIIERNWRCRTGEIDLIAQYDGLLIFIEVRTRSGGFSFGTAEESVNTRKQQKVRETARFYTLRHHMLDVQVRFDVISVLTTRDGARISLDHISNAF